jgi:hypothetical protein
MATNHGGAVSGQNSLWFDPYYNFLPLQTRPINTVNGGMIRFWLRCGDGSTLNWLPPESHVQMNLHFSTTNFPTTLVAAYPSSSYRIWRQIELPIPPEAQSPAAQFEWYAKSDDHYTGHWALDDVEVIVRTNIQRPRLTRDLPDVRTMQGKQWVTSIAVEGSGEWKFLWFHNGTFIPLFNPKTTFGGIGTPSDGGTYFVIASNLFGAVTSRVAQVTIVPPLTLAEALDLDGLTVAMDTNSFSQPIRWEGVIDETHDGQDAWHLANYGDGIFQPTLTSTIQGPGELTFWWKSGTEPGFSTRYTVVENGQTLALISGNTQWRHARIELTEGEHNLRWGSFSDDLPSTRAKARIWLDQVRFVPAPATGPEIVRIQGVPGADNVIQAGTALRFQVESLGYDLTFQWTKDGTNMPGASFRSFELSSAMPSDSGLYRVVVSNALGTATSQPIILSVLTTSANGALLGEATDATHLQWSTSPEAPWSRVISSSHDGEDAARSPDTSDDTVTWIETQVVGPGTISFWWRASTEPTYDQLTFYDNSRPLRYIDGETEWRFEIIPVTAGAHTLRWTYEKDDVTSAGSDHVWLDQVAFNPGAPQSISIGDAVDQPALQWIQDPMRPWLGQTNLHHDGVSAASSGMVERGTTNHLTLKITGPLTLSFWWRLASVDTWDLMWVTIDGVSVSRLVGDTAWRPALIAVPDGNHDVTWWYHHNGGYFFGDSQGLLDQVSVRSNRFEFPPDGIQVRADGSFALRFSGAPGQLVVTEVSSNLVDWIPFSTNFVSSTGQMEFVVPVPEGSNKARFFRTRW